jgi:hypothetical protein
MYTWWIYRHDAILFFLQKQSVVVELLLMKKTQARLQQRCVSYSQKRFIFRLLTRHVFLPVWLVAEK